MELQQPECKLWSIRDNSFLCLKPAAIRVMLLQYSFKIYIHVYNILAC